MRKSTRSRWGGATKKLVCSVAAVALSVGLLPSAAFATDAMSTYYALPGADEVVNFEHTATDDNGNSYTYKYVTIGAEGAAYANARKTDGTYGTSNRVAPMAQTYYEVLGLNYINAYRGVDTIFNWTNTQSEGLEKDTQDFTDINTAYTSGSQGGLQTRNASLAILGTTNNVSPDEYIWNYCCWANGATVADTDMTMDTGNAGLEYLSVEVDGVEYTNFPRQIYWETDIINASDSSATVCEGANNAALSWSEWVEIEQAREGGSSDYDPYFAKFSATSGSASKMVAGLHTLASTVDSVVAQSVDSNGNYTLQTRFGGNVADGTGSMINAYEDIVQAPEYYALSKIADGTVEKKVTAVLAGYDPQTGNYACRKYGVESDPETNLYGGRIANYLAPISTSIADLGLESAQATSGDNAETEDAYVQWLTPEQIAENCDAAFAVDVYSQNKISNYLATATDGAVHTVYYTEIGNETTGDDTEDNTEALESARAKLIAAGKDACDFCYSYPCTMFGNFYAQGVENGMISLVACAYTYPEIFTGGIADLFAYWAKNVWHITDSSLASVVESATAGMQLSDGEEVGDVSEAYEANANAVFYLGNSYYLNNYETIDAINGGCLKTYDLSSLESRVTTQSSDYLNNLVKTLNSELESAQSELESLKQSSAATKSELESAQNQVTSLTAQLASLKGSTQSDTVTIDKATVTAADISDSATTVILGSKVKKISAKAFSGKKATSVIVQSKKLKKAKVKKCFKGSSVKTVQVPGSKYKAYKKIFTKKIVGKKVKVV